MFEGRVLALDLARTTGWAFGPPGSIPTFGHIRFTKPGGTRAEIYREFRRWLNAKWAKAPDVIVYELPAVPSIMSGRTNIETIRTLIGLAEHLEEWAHNRIELKEATVSSVRVHFIGANLKSAFAKQKTYDQCRMLGWDVENFDQADACALWDFQCCWLNPKLAAYNTPLFRR